VRDFGVVSDRRIQVAVLEALLLEDVTVSTLAVTVYSRITGK
jgi:hypothetical protein